MGAGTQVWLQASPSSLAGIALLCAGTALLICRHLRFMGAGAEVWLQASPSSLAGIALLCAGITL